LWTNKLRVLFLGLAAFVCFAPTFPSRKKIPSKSNHFFYYFPPQFWSEQRSWSPPLIGLTVLVPVFDALLWVGYEIQSFCWAPRGADLTCHLQSLSSKVNWYRTSHHLGPAGMSTPPPTPHWHLLCGFPEKNSELV
jgi:hypothetical protein